MVYHPNKQYFSDVETLPLNLEDFYYIPMKPQHQDNCTQLLAALSQRHQAAHLFNEPGYAGTTYVINIKARIRNQK